MLATCSFIANIFLLPGRMETRRHVEFARGRGPAVLVGSGPAVLVGSGLALCLAGPVAERHVLRFFTLEPGGDQIFNLKL
jgi:hypothetical protein